MMELLEYRVKLIERLDEAAREFRLACESIDDPFTKVEGEWTAHQIASHTRDVEKLVYGARIRRTQSEDDPEFTSFNPDDWMDSQYKRDESLAGILDEFVANIEKLCADLKTLPLEAWSRESRHETLGEGLTVQLWVERSLAHIEEHLVGINKIQTSEF